MDNNLNRITQQDHKLLNPQPGDSADFLLRPWRPDDVESLVEHANNSNIAKFMTNAFRHPYGNDDAERFIIFATKDDPVHIFAIEVEGKAVGSIGVHLQEDIMSKNAELGYWLGEKYWSRGIITKAVKQMVDFGFKTYDINRIFARPFGTNIGSQKVLEKAGFRLEAKLEKTIFKNGVFLDELIYAVRREMNKVE